MRYAMIIGAAAVSLILALGASVLGGLLPLIVSVVSFFLNAFVPDRRSDRR